MISTVPAIRAHGGLMSLPTAGNEPALFQDYSSLDYHYNAKHIYVEGRPALQVHFMPRKLIGGLSCFAIRGIKPSHRKSASP
jgi:hypothetical protein